MIRVTNIESDNLGHRLRLREDSEQDSLIDKAVTGGEDWCSPINKAVSTGLAVAEEDNIETTLIKNDLHRPTVIKSLLGLHLRVIKLPKPLFLS